MLGQAKSARCADVGDDNGGDHQESAVGTDVRADRRLDDPRLIHVLAVSSVRYLLPHRTVPYRTLTRKVPLMLHALQYEFEYSTL